MTLCAGDNLYGMGGKVLIKSLKTSTKAQEGKHGTKFLGKRTNLMLTTVVNVLFLHIYNLIIQKSNMDAQTSMWDRIHHNTSNPFGIRRQS